MLRDFIRKVGHVNVPKRVRYMAIKAFATLQNSITLTESSQIFEEICYLFLSERSTERCRNAERFLMKDSQKSENTDELEIDLPEIEMDDECQRKTIREASPFSPIFHTIVETVTRDANENSVGSRNEFYCPNIVEILDLKYLPMIPLWSGLMLGTKCIEGDVFDIARDTNSFVESWFKYVKHDIGAKPRARPAKFVIDLKVAIESRLRLFEFPGAEKKKTRRQPTMKNQSDANLNSHEETWKPKGKRNTFHKTPSTRAAPETQVPNVMKWGGSKGNISLANTCTIDNGLTILHLTCQQHEAFRNYLLNDDTELSRVLVNIFELMNNEEFTDAKLQWLAYTKCDRTDLFGDEFDFFVRHINSQWESKCQTKCDSPGCPEPMREIRETSGVTVGLQDNFNNIQRLVDTWMNDETPCLVPLNREDFSDTEDGSSAPRCAGRRVLARHITNSCPVVIFRVHEHCLYGRISLEDVLNSKVIVVNDQQFQLAGVTFHYNNHYTAVTMINGSRHWYDGLHGGILTMVYPRNFRSWLPVHAVYARIA